MTITPEQRAEWKALCKKATPGEWKKFAHEIRAIGSTDTYSGAVYGTIMFCESTQQMDDEGRVWTTGGNSHDNAAFVEASRTALPALISHIEALEDENARLKEALAWFHHNGKALASDIYSAHRLRGNGASQWMTEDDRDFRRDLDAALDRARAAMGESK